MAGSSGNMGSRSRRTATCRRLTYASTASMALMRPSKGERRLTSRAGGEHSRTHGDEAGPEDLVCTRSSGGGRRGGGDFRIGDALMLSNPNKRARKGKIRINELNSASDYALIKKTTYEPNRRDSTRKCTSTRGVIYQVPLFTAGPFFIS